MARNTMRVHYDGWISLPSAVRRLLGIATSDEVVWEIVGQTVVLRPAGATTAEAASTMEETAADQTAAREKPAAVADTAKPARKSAAARKPKPSLALPKLPGRGRKASTSS
ncbi:hypothetical protein SH611_21695 [Geminicoccaceae bacterium 1502E]|nr:hypothetical protein [Geminicoccaceae bacterium 1502E]